MSDFERHFHLPHQTIKKRLEPFLKLKVLVEEKRQRFLFYKLNLKNPLTKECLAMCEKELLIEFLEKSAFFSQLYKEMAQFFPNAKLLVFGSAATEKNFSDIDMLAISDNRQIPKAADNFSQTYGKKIHLVMTNETELKTAFIEEIRKKHIILNGHEYFMEVMYK